MVIKFDFTQIHKVIERFPKGILCSLSFVLEQVSATKIC